MKKILSLVLVLAIALGASTAFAQEGTSLTMGIWGIEGVVKAHEIACAGIHDTIPEISEMKLIVYPTSDDFFANLPSQIAASSAPDIVKCDYTYMYEYISNGYFVALDESVLDLSSYSQSAVDVFRVDGQLYGLPINAQPFCFIINKDLWKQYDLGDIPNYWSEIEKAGEVLAADNKPLLIFDNNIVYVTSIVQSFGGSWNRGIGIDSPENIEALDFIINMFRKGAFVSPESLGVADSSTAFTQGQAPLIMGGPWYNSIMASAAPDTDFALIMFPCKTDETRAFCPTIDGYFVVKNNKDTTLSTKSLNWVDRKEFQQAFTDSVGAMMSNLELREVYFDTYKTAENLKNAMDYIQDPMFPQNASEFANVVITELGEAIYNPNSTLTGADVIQNIKNVLNLQ